MNYLKSVLGFSLMVFLIFVTPTDMFAQQHSKKSNKRKGKVSQAKNKVKSNNANRKQTRLRRGANVRTLPTNHATINHRGANYYYNNGTFYRPNNGNYIIVAAPIGIRVSTLPPNPFRFIFGKRAYLYSYGSYYIPLNAGGYEVVGVPIGARVNTLPNGCNVVELDNTVYYRTDETYYKKVIEPSGSVVYEIVRI